LAKNENKPTYISLFSSAGVGCYGFKENNFDCIATNELLSKRLQIQKYNNKCKYNSGYIDGSLGDAETQDKIIAEIDLWKSKHKITVPDVIIATPPCQGMSVANHKKKNEQNRNSLVVESIKITLEVLPKFFIFENVRSFLNTTCTDLDGIDKTISEAITLNLSGRYNIQSKIINFKEYGSNSSRTRTLVIGVKKDIKHISPYDLFPSKKSPVILEKLIGDLPELIDMGEISSDIYHNYRAFDKKMLPWIENLSEGQSAFSNTDESRIPHRFIDGEKVYNKSKNGDKYARWYWHREGPCIHTRNDILSSQNTIHPRDNRVFSIRENFKWTNAKEINEISLLESKVFLKKEVQTIASITHLTYKLVA
jgi:DNA (cytosine-5)-methyltransferase 1